MAEIDVKKLRELAQKATPGPWAVDTECLDGHGRLYVSKGRSDYLLGRILEVFQNCLVRSKQRMANAEYIAAANPATILVICDRLEAAEKDAGRYRTFLKINLQQLAELRYQVNQEGKSIDDLLDALAQRQGEGS
ncbi:ead/Ea22-like family protein [Burkholderia humptydooensis]|uniref:Ead/Ea22-like family protein n=1 Tax=Burkholderia humptydooensis TaxID=430531 RepID=A0A7U4PBM4_9BURK|nr:MULTISPECIES: ead/Ea22-like family protein [Burkholderia]AJY40198.1 ead/Ea22-like family protein [Burkholderia sp. 2002721687]ALX46454.1 hypothetical protein AQ610_29335 [Burkholderia humptydooensis]QPS45762.1 ead/Ea22-like family protein [Burkholderia humptydooensis]